MSSATFKATVQSKAVASLYLDDVTADVYFLVKSKKKEIIPVHKCLLMAASVEFHAKFTGPWKGKEEILIVDASSVALKEFLCYFYSNEVKLSMEHVEEVMYLGSTYNISDCMNDCSQLLAANLTVDNVCWAYQLAIQFDCDELTNECEVMISLNSEAVFKTAGFKDCDREILSHILRIDAMSCSEIEVFNACMAWVKTASKKDTLTKDSIESHLANLLYDIRYCSMMMEEFDEIYKSYGYLFSSNDHKAIVDMIKSKKSRKSKPRKFNKNPRQNPWNESTKIDCNREDDISAEAYAVQHIETATFSTNKTLLLHTVSFAEVYESYYDPMEEPYFLEGVLDVKLTIYEIHPFINAKENLRMIYIDENAKLTDGNTEISLVKPIVIRRGFKYQIQLEQMNKNEHIGVTATTLKTEVTIKPDIIVKFDEGPMQNDENRGLIWELKFTNIFK